MDNKFLFQKRMNAQQKYRRKVILVIVLAVILVALILGGLIKVIADEKKAEKNVEDITVNIPSASKEEESHETINTGVPKVVIDPGHGGNDLGSAKGGLEEKNANIAIALCLQEILEELGYEVYMIRTDDSRVDNETRPVLASEQGGDIYVSIHQNSLDEDSDATRGCEVWYSDLRNDGSDVLSQYVVDALAESTGTRNRGIKVSNKLIVLKYTEMPACLVECGFMSSETERTNLFTPEYQQKIAQGIANGIVKYLPLE